MIHHDDQDDSGAENVSAKQYTIMVRNLPKDTSVVELVQHFSTLYALDQVDALHDHAHPRNHILETTP